MSLVIRRTIEIDNQDISPEGVDWFLSLEIVEGELVLYFNSGVQNSITLPLDSVGSLAVAFTEIQNALSKV